MRTSALSTSIDRYVAVRALTEQLAAPLSAEDQVVQSMPDVSPTKWHRAHVTWFFETFLLSNLSGYVPFDPHYGYLFNSYYEAVGPRHPRPQRGLLTRPSVDEVASYRRYVDEAMVDALQRKRFDETLLALVELGLHHEQQHQELMMMDIKHVLSMNPMRPAYAACTFGPAGTPAPVQWISHDGGLVEIGRDAGVADTTFAFDNEGPRHSVFLRPFRLANRLVTNGEWLEFVNDDGYRRPELWLSDGWFIVSQERWEAPLYWDRDGDRFTVYTLRGMQPLRADEPVCHVSFFEADAFARWKGARLPTEAEWEVVAGGRHIDGNLLDSGSWHPMPATLAHHQLFGDVWEWTSSAYLSYPGFRPAAGAVGEYNGKFMNNQYVLRGGCCVTPPGHVRATYRNFFPPHARWAFSGLRLASDQ